MISTFYDTKNCFKTYTHYIEPLSYDDWTKLPEDHKAAVLYVQFFSSIISAWNAAKSYDGDDEEAVETVLQYLLKNVPVIEKNPSRFTARYIYRVAYNCMYCICHDRKCDKERRENEISASQLDDSGNEWSLFDTVASTSCRIEDAINSKIFWEFVENLDVETRVLFDRIAALGRVPASLSARNLELLADLRAKLNELTARLL